MPTSNVISVDGIDYRQCECDGWFSRIATLNEGNDQGWGIEELHQCDKCKSVDVFDRSYPGDPTRRRTLAFMESLGDELPKE